MTTPSQNLSLRYYPDPVLKTVCSECNWEKHERNRVGHEMLEIMYANHGYGLSAPQVGITSNFFVMRDPDRPTGQPGLIFANPEITDLSNKKVKLQRDACLCLA